MTGEINFPKMEYHKMSIINIGIIGEFHASKSQIVINNSLDWLKKNYNL